MRLDLSLLEVFCIVCEEGGFSKAGIKLRLSQPTVSGHIRNLEDYIGTKLFDRLPRNIVPTPAGELLYQRGRAILDQREGAIQDLTKFLGRIEGSLTVSASTIPGEYLTPRLLLSFHSRFPRVRVDLRLSDSRGVCEDVVSGKAEIGLAGAKLPTVGLSFRLFASDELVLVAPKSKTWLRVHSITLEDLARTPFLVREVGSGTRLAFEEKIGRSLDDFNIVASFGSTSALKEGVKAGLGAGVLSRLAVRSEIKSGVLKPLKIEGVDPIRRDFFVVLNERRTRSPLAESFLTCALSTTNTVARSA